MAAAGKLRNTDGFWLARRFWQFALDQPRSFTNIPYLLHFLRRQLEAELFFQRKHEVQMLNRVPSLDRIGRGLSRDSIGGKCEQIGCYAANLVENGYGQLCSPSPVFNRIHSGVAIV